MNSRGPIKQTKKFQLTAMPFPLAATGAGEPSTSTPPPATPAPSPELDRSVVTSDEDIPFITEKVKVSRIGSESTEEEFAAFIHSSCVPLTTFIERMKAVKIGTDYFPFVVKGGSRVRMNSKQDRIEFEITREGDELARRMVVMTHQFEGKVFVNERSYKRALNVLIKSIVAGN